MIADVVKLVFLLGVALALFFVAPHAPPHQLHSGCDERPGGSIAVLLDGCPR